MTPYLCKVCGETYATSDEIVVHIIQHCDENTALRRQPQSGPRKYKRRRKVKSHDTSRVSDNYDLIDNPSDSDDNTKRKTPRKKQQQPQQQQQHQQQQQQQQQRSTIEEGYENVLKTFESSMQNINSLVTNSKSPKAKVTKKKIKREDKKLDSPITAQLGRSKMIHTQKTRVPVDIGCEGVKKGQKTKTMITRTPKLITEGHKLGIFPGGERNRPRTKNVSYHVENKSQIVPATFGKKNNEDDNVEGNVSSPEIPIDEELETSIEEPNENVNVKLEPGLRNQNGVEEKMMKKKVIKRGRRPRHIVIKQEPREELIDEMIHETDLERRRELETTIDEEIVDGNAMEVAFEANVVSTEESILPDLDKENNHNDEEDNNQLGKNVKVNVKVESTPQRVVAAHNLIAPSDEAAETIIPDSLESLEHTCEMCSAVFPSHAELLVHVPIHI